MHDLTSSSGQSEDTGETPQRGLALLQTMARIREFELAAAAAHKRGEIPGVVHQSIGQEAIAAGVCANLRRSDYLTSTHRGHGHAIAKGANALAMMAELYGRSTGTCGGKGGSMHIADFSVGMLGANGVVAGGIPIAVGAAQGARLLGTDAVVACFFGDGAINRGPFLEGLNWAAVFTLPVLFVCEDNNFSAFSHTGTLTGGAGAATRAESCGIAAVTVDGNDAFAVDAAARRMIGEIRTGGGPRLLHAKTYRLEGHTSSDPARYRKDDDVTAWRERDPLVVMRERLLSLGVAASDLHEVQSAAHAEMADAAAAAFRAPWPSPEATFSDVQDVGAP